MSWHALMERDRGRCRYCGVTVTKETRTKDHVVPRCEGGSNRIENVVTACHPCNNRKGDRTPAQARMRLLPPTGRITSVWLPVAAPPVSQETP